MNVEKDSARLGYVSPELNHVENVIRHNTLRKMNERMKMHPELEREIFWETIKSDFV